MKENKKELSNSKNKKKKGIGKYILLVILLLILIAVAAAAIYFYSLWRTAKDFERELDLEHFSYVVDVDLEMEGLTKEQLDFMQVLARITGLEQEEILQMHIEGSVWEDRVYAAVSFAGSAVPLTELYLSSGDDFVNASLFYDTVRREMVAKNALLERMLPAIAENTYMTLEQAEKLSGENLSVVSDFEPFFSQYNLSAVEYFAALAVLPHLEHEEGSVLVLREVKEPSMAEGEKAALYFEVEQPAQVVERNVQKYEKILSRLNINIDGSSFKALKRLAVTVSSDGVQEIVMPENVMTQEQLDTIQEIQKLVEGIANLVQASPQELWDVISKLLGGNQN